MIKLRVRYILLILFLFTSMIWFLVCYYKIGGDTVDSILMAIFLGAVTSFLYLPIRETRQRIRKGIDPWAKLETDPEVVKAHMLFVMQWGHEHGVKGAIKEFNEIFRNYPDWRLHDWEVFRAWYKDLIDHIISFHGIHALSGPDGEPYTRENDDMYDPEAPDWKQFDRRHYYDYDVDDDDDDEESDNFDDGYGYDDDDDYSDGGHKLKRSAEEGFYTGIGIGAGMNI